jgi:hypothetical protein
MRLQITYGISGPLPFVKFVFAGTYEGGMMIEGEYSLFVQRSNVGKECFFTCTLFHNRQTVLEVTLLYNAFL